MNNQDVLKERVTIYEVAHAANVSLATVSRVINNRGNVTAKTKARVEAAIERLGYQPSALAQSLATSRTTNIAILIPSPNYVYISNMLTGMIDVGKIYGYKTNIFTCDNDEDAAKAIDKIITSRVDGVLIFNPFISHEQIKRLSKYKLHSVLIAKDLTDPYMATVQIDFETAITKRVEMYLKKGITDIAYLDNNEPMSQRFLTAIEKTFEAHGKKFVNRIAVEDSYTTVYDYFTNVFKHNVPHRVYLASRDSLAIAIQNAATDLGIQVGKTVDVLGIIGTKYSVMARPQLSSINLDLYEVGSIAMRMLTKMLNNTLTNSEFRFSCEFTKRQSSQE